MKRTAGEAGTGTERDLSPDRPRRASADEAAASAAGFRLWWGGVAAVLLVNLIWAVWNRMPPVWDMALHQRLGWEFMQALRGGSFLARFAGISDYYPPLVHLYEALIYLVLGPNPLLAFLVNLPGSLLLSFFTYRLAREAYSPKASAVCGILTLLTPLVAWTARETLLDVSLSGWVACAYYLVWKSRGFADRKWTIGFCLVSAAGMLTKWTFAVFLAPVVVWSWMRSDERSRGLLNLLDGTLLGLPVVLGWYLPNLRSLGARFQLTAQGAVWEHDPGLSSLAGWLYYPRCLSGYYLFLPLTLLALWGAVCWVRERRQLPLSGLLAVALLGGMAVLTGLEAKDPRYVMPLVAPVSILVVGAVHRRSYRLYGLLAFAFLQFLSLTFPLPGGPKKVALFTVAPDPDYVGMGREWVLYESDYFGVVGAPRRQDWGYAAMLEFFATGDRVGFVPDAPFFHPGALTLLAAQRGMPLEVVRIGATQASAETLARMDWVVGKTGAQGISFLTRYNEQIYAALESQHWPIVAEPPLPDQGRMIIWRNPIRSR